MKKIIVAIFFLGYVILLVLAGQTGVFSRQTTPSQKTVSADSGSVVTMEMQISTLHEGFEDAVTGDCYKNVNRLQTKLGHAREDTWTVEDRKGFVCMPGRIPEDFLCRHSACTIPDSRQKLNPIPGHYRAAVEKFFSKSLLLSERRVAVIY